MDVRVLGIDWSGDKRAPARKRWVAEAVGGHLIDVRRGDKTEAMAPGDHRAGGGGPSDRRAGLRLLVPGVVRPRAARRPRRALGVECRYRPRRAVVGAMRAAVLGS